MNRWYLIEIQDVDAPEIKYNFIGKQVREDGAYELYQDQDGHCYFVLNESGDFEESPLELAIKVSLVCDGASMAALRENEKFKKYWTGIREIGPELDEWPPKILRDLP